MTPATTLAALEASKVSNDGTICESTGEPSTILMTAPEVHRRAFRLTYRPPQQHPTELRALLPHQNRPDMGDLVTNIQDPSQTVRWKLRGNGACSSTLW